MNWDFLPSSLAVRLAETFAHFLWQGTLLALLVSLAMRLMSRASSARRYTVLIAFMGVCAACPAITFVVLRGSLIKNVSSAQIVVIPRILSGPIRTEPKTQASSADVSKVVATAEPDSQLKGRVDPTAERPVFVSASAHWDVEKVARTTCCCYILGLFLMLLRLGVGIWGGQRLRRLSNPIDDPALLAALVRQVRRIGLYYSPAVAYCSLVSVPVVVGVLRPILLLPIAITTQLPMDQIELLIAHELAHIRRLDHVFQLIQRLIEAFLFFHPAIWFISRRINFERECCCDEMAIGSGVERNQYANSLLRIAEIASRLLAIEPPQMALAATGKRSEIGKRIIRLIEPEVHEQFRLTQRSMLATGIIVFISALSPLYVHARQMSFPSMISRPSGVASVSYDLLEEKLKADPNLVKQRQRDGRMMLHQAAESGRREEVELLLKYHADPNAKMNENWAPLHYAAHNGNVDVAELLVSAGGDINARTHDGRTPLMVAIGVAGVQHGPSFRSQSIVRWMLQNGANVQAADDTGYTALHYAAQMDNASVINLLLTAGAKLEARDRKGRTPLFHSVNTAMSFDALLAAGADPHVIDDIGLNLLDCIGTTTATITASPEIKQIAAKLIDLKVPLNFQAAVYLELPDQAKQILKKDPSQINNRRLMHGQLWSALHYAAARGEPSMVKLLLENDADPNLTVGTEGPSALTIAITYRARPEVITLLLKANANPNVINRQQKGNRPLHTAAVWGTLEHLRLLVQAHADVNARNDLRQTPLHQLLLNARSSDAEKLEMAKFLLASGADPKLADESGQTPLHLAAQAGAAPIAEVLLSYGAQVNARNVANETPLHLAITGKDSSIAVINLLLKYGALREVKDQSGLTPLMRAKGMSATAAAKLLSPD